MLGRGLGGGWKVVRVEGWWVLVCVGGEASLLVLLLMVGEKLLMLVSYILLESSGWNEGCW